MKFLIRLCAPALLILALASQAFAAPQGYAVAPFQVNAPAEYEHLQKAIPQMLSSRLHWQGHFQAAKQDAAAKASIPASTEAASALRSSLGVDYLVWGDVNVINKASTINVYVVDRAGKVWSKAAQSPASDMISALQRLADAISTEVWQRPPVGVTSAQPGEASSGGKVIKPMNPEMMTNEVDAANVYMNPEIRYEGYTGSDAYIRSQALPFPSVGFAVDDIDLDGKNEIVILTDHQIYIFKFQDGKLVQLAEHDFPYMINCLAVSVAKIDSGLPKLVVAAQDDRGGPSSLIATYSKGEVRVEADKIRYYLSSIKEQGTLRPVIVGQAAESASNKFKPGVFEMLPNGDGTLSLGSPLNLPKDATVFSFAYLPGGAKDEDHLVVLSPEERLRVYTLSGSRLAETEEKYSGSAVGFPMTKDIKGLGKDRQFIPDTYYIPLPMIPCDLDNDGRFELLVNRPISTAAQFFPNYRFYPQGEIHAMYWDGIGLNLSWKTRRIKGSVIGLALADFNNDGVLDLVTCINTHPGTLGINARKTVVQGYPLDLSKTNAHTEPYNPQMEN